MDTQDMSINFVQVRLAPADAHPPQCDRAVFSDLVVRGAVPALADLPRAAELGRPDRHLAAIAGPSHLAVVVGQGSESRDGKRRSSAYREEQTCLMVRGEGGVRRCARALARLYGTQGQHIVETYTRAPDHPHAAPLPPPLPALRLRLHLPPLPLPLRLPFIFGPTFPSEAVAPPRAPIRMHDLSSQ